MYHISVRWILGDEANFRVDYVSRLPESSALVQRRVFLLGSCFGGGAKSHKRSFVAVAFIRFISFLQTAKNAKAFT